MCNNVKYNNGVQVTYTANIQISECSARALDALVGYGDDAFIEEFKTKLGTDYIRDHVTGLKEFFAQIRSEVIPQIRLVDNLRKASKQTRNDIV